MLRLPSAVPLWIDLRRWLLLGWVTISTPGYMASAKVHYRPSHWGIAGTRIHTLYVWRDTGQTRFETAKADYIHQCGSVIDRIDDDGRCFLNLILEYFS